MDGTYVEEDEVEEDVHGVVTGLDGVSPRTELENQGDDNEKELEDMRLRIEELEIDLANAKDALASLLNSKAELQEIERKDVEMVKVQKELAEAKDKTAKLKSRNDALMVKSKEADMARYRIQSLEETAKELRGFLASLKG
ncbi:hypothetical protein GIB67_018704 [Kingdonia uniflora]|uniref:Uncharacterized protein n=1 Tax=Kingdonia uniflora TaxID=39325 RepID=A0A7J7L243_9MAGN|nr:hypothetical protein GIB67_018704 [Kingdonia uniflora]